MVHKNKHKVESIFLHTDFGLNNTKGECVVELQYKNNALIYKLHEDKIEPERKEAVDIWWEGLRASCLENNIALYNCEEINEQLRLKKIEMQRKGQRLPKYPKQKDLWLDIHDKASGKKAFMIVGASSTENCPEFEKDYSAREKGAVE
jgi:hypothetical protein